MHSYDHFKSDMACSIGRSPVFYYRQLSAEPNNCNFRALLVDRWAQRGAAQILQKHAEIYTDWDPQHREPIMDLLNYPLRDDNGYEVNIFDKHGNRIPRLTPLSADHGVGIMAKLRGLDHLFFDDADEIDVDVFENDRGEITNRGPRSTYSVYPQAGTREYGHVQARILPDVFRPYLQRINDAVASDPFSATNPRSGRRALRRHQRQNALNNRHRGGSLDLEEHEPQYESEDSLHSDDMLSSSTTRAKPIVATAIQKYGLLTHRARLSAADHDAQQGQLTAFFSGAYADTEHHKAKYKKVVEGLVNGLPHQRFADKVKTANVPRDWRIEVNYSITMDDLNPEFRTGS